MNVMVLTLCQCARARAPPSPPLQCAGAGLDAAALSRRPQAARKADHSVPSFTLAVECSATAWSSPDSVPTASKQTLKSQNLLMVFQPFPLYLFTYLPTTSGLSAIPALHLILRYPHPFKFFKYSTRSHPTENMAVECNECKLEVASKAALKAHWQEERELDNGHYHCHVCVHLFHTPEAEDQHRREVSINGFSCFWSSNSSSPCPPSSTRPSRTSAAPAAMSGSVPRVV